MKKNEKLPTTLYILGGISLVIAPTAFLFFGMFVYLQAPEISESAVQGTVQCEPKTTLAVSEPACFSYRTIDGVRKSVKSPYASLKKETLGNPLISIALVDGKVKEAILPEKSLKGWKRCRADRKKVPSLAAFDFDIKTKKTFPNYSISEWGIRPGQTLTVLFGPDGKTVSKLWCGTADDQTTAQSAARGIMLVVSCVIAALFGVLGMIFFAVGFWMSQIQAKRRDSP